MNRTATQDGAPGVAMALMPTGVPGLDDILGGGLPAFSFSLIAGGPGSGKTTMAMQMLFATSTVERPGLFITLLGETSLKLLRYQQTFDFFDVSAIGTRVHLLNLSEEALDGDLDAVLARIVHEVTALRPGMVVVDSFRSLVQSHRSDDRLSRVAGFVQRLALHLTTWHITSVLIGESHQLEAADPVYTVADGILLLSQDVERNSIVRKLQVVKARGLRHLPGLHTLRITGEGIRAFPRAPVRLDLHLSATSHRLSSGIPALDAIMGGGIPVGDSLVLTGPTGSGKTTFAMQFVRAGLAAGETAVVAIFEERPEVYLERADRFGPEIRDAVATDRLRVIYLRPLDLSVDETLQEIRDAVQALGAVRVVIDSINGFEMALAPTFRADFRESLYRLIGALTRLGVTIYSTVETEALHGGTLTGYHVSFLTDIIISQRYLEMEGAMRKALLVVKMRGSDHSRAFRLYELSSSGVDIGSTLTAFNAVSSGHPMRSLRSAL